MRHALRPVRVLAAGLIVALAAGAAVPHGQSGPQPDVRALYSRQDVSIPMRDGTQPVHDDLRPADGRTYPMLLMRTPYSIPPYGADPTPGSSARPSRSQRTAHLRLPGRSRPLHVRRRLRQHDPAPRQRGPTDIDESTDAWDTIDWLVKHVPQPQRAGRALGHLLTRLLRRGHDRRPSRARGRRRRRRPRRLVLRRRLPPQRRLLLAYGFNFFSSFGQPAARADAPGARIRFTAPPTATGSSSTWDRSPTSRKYFNGEVAVLEGDHGTMATTTTSGRRGTSAAFEEYRARGDDRRRLVRCREPLRPARGRTAP